MLSNWKTSLAGVGAILTGLLGLIHFFVPDVAGPSLDVSISSLIAGIGLLFAKDASKK